MTEVIDRAGNWILTDELCLACGAPSWDLNPGGVVKDRWTCRCGHRHQPVSIQTCNEIPLPDISELVA